VVVRSSLAVDRDPRLVLREAGHSHGADDGDVLRKERDEPVIEAAPVHVGEAQLGGLEDLAIPVVVSEVHPLRLEP